MTPDINVILCADREIVKAEWIKTNKIHGYAVKYSIFACR